MIIKKQDVVHRSAVICFEADAKYKLEPTTTSKAENRRPLNASADDEVECPPMKAAKKEQMTKFKTLN